MRRVVWAAAAATVTMVAACQESTVGPDTGGLALQIYKVNVQRVSAASASPDGPSLTSHDAPLDSGRVTLSGPTSKTIAASAGQAITIDGLSPGSYSILLEGWSGDVLTYSGQRSGVQVTAGSDTQVTELLFIPTNIGFTALDETVQLTGHPAGTVWNSSDAGIVSVTSAGLLTAVGNGSADITATLGPANAAAATRVSQLVSSVTVAPANATIDAGQTLQFTATALDSLSNPVLGVNVLWISSDHNVATIDQSGLASGTGGGAATIIAAVAGEPGSAALSVNSATGPAAQLAFSVQPTNTIQGAAITPAIEVTIQDAGGLRVSSTAAVTLAIGTNPGAASLGGTVTTNAVAGVASFSGVSLDAAGTGYTLSASSSGLTSATSTAFDVSAVTARPAYLQFIAEPTNHSVGEVMGAVQVEILDANGDRITTATDAVELTLRDLPDELNTISAYYPLLYGTTTKNAVAGVATFDDLQIDRRMGAGFSLEARIGVTFPVAGPQGVPGSQIAAVSQPFNVQMVGESVALGAYHTCALTDTQRAVCWGYNGYGQIGGRFGGTDASPAWSASAPSFLQLAAGYYHTCGLTASPGDIYCWGRNSEGQVGNTQVPGEGTGQPAKVEAGSLKFTQVAAGDFHTCGLTDTYQVWCWGYNGYGAIGDSTFVNRQIPERADAGAALTQAFESITAGQYHTCALNQAPDSRAFCWGFNGYGQLGDSTTLNKPYAVPLADSIAFTTIDAGFYHTCGATSTVSYCWGNNWYGQLGDSTTVQKIYPNQVAALGNTGGVTGLALGGYFSCALTSTPDALCWGYNYNGQVGNGTVTGTEFGVLPVTGGAAATHISAGAYHACAVNSTGQVYCWGQGNNGQLGTGDFENLNPTPRHVPGTGL